MHQTHRIVLDAISVYVLAPQSCLTLCDPMDCSRSGSSVHGILQARTLEWVTIPFSRGSSRPRDRTQVSCIAGRFFSIWTTSEGQFFLKGRSKQRPPPPVATTTDGSVTPNSSFFSHAQSAAVRFPLYCSTPDTLVAH